MGNPIITDFYDTVVDLVGQKHLQTRVERQWLGGDAGPSGGQGMRPGGFIGQLIQRLVAYDTSEDATPLGSGTLVDNLNHIRYNIQTLSGVLTNGFLGLNDTPDTYSGMANRVVIVNDTETGLEFTDTIAGGNSSVQHVMRWSAASGISQLDLPDVADTIFYVTNNGLTVDPLLYELSDDGTTIFLSGVVTGDTVFSSHYLLRTE